MNELQVLQNGKWAYVFCRNELTGIVTTENKEKALCGQDALLFFQSKFANSVFRSVNMKCPKCDSLYVEFLDLVHFPNDRKCKFCGFVWEEAVRVVKT